MTSVQGDVRVARAPRGGRTATSYAEVVLWRGSPRIVSWALLVTLITVALVGYLVGTRSVSYTRLQSDVSAGRTHLVGVDGALPSGAEGFSTVTFRWKVGWRSYVTRVREVTPGTNTQGSDESVDAITSGPGIVDRLRETQPGLRISSTSPAFDSPVFLGVRYPTWAAWALTAVWIAVLLWIWIALAPWRATRWAWWWLVLLAPVLGLPAYLALGGPTGLVPPPRQLRQPGTDASVRRPWVLTGGFAFIFVVLFGAFFRVRA